MIISEDSGIATIMMPESINFSCVTGCSQQIRACKDRDITHVILDFKNTTYIDSSGLGLILIIRDVICKDIEFINCNLDLIETFKSSNFQKLFHIKR
jgi:anti-anti-sigma factor